MFRFAKSVSLQSLSHQFTQKCSASGTPKGKAKLKTGVRLKRNIVTTKKGSASKSEKPYMPDAKQKLYEQCLNAPTPVRYLSPKDRKREIEREKLGLVSKDRQREIEILKKGGKESMGISKEPMIMGTPGLDLISLGIVDAEKIPKYELTAEDGQRLAKEYSRILMRKHRARQAAETNLLRLKKEAIEALPEGLKEAALVPDLTPFPANKFMATLTPPIEGYMEQVTEATRRGSGKEKLR
ncbi:uncharacterized protein LOC116130894 [Pistacia vera]|uniref:uncharacterized protein LOC116130894 n=1 Tax=Pistacia vera TaxID=55513 RepID=UPI0012635D05|nr:uncharacterized protein LOC116130894 [Pistacia vera]XP_031272450.1 uncharacterized protein LOC116130894 [Pistacia vera]XP_031272451.1 uncharacterized protein LOC116130894 [Pistacia vera]XP_031272452.1 uncharacterized protein LOC116130894 [Pistacia vera]